MSNQQQLLAALSLAALCGPLGVPAPAAAQQGMVVVRDPQTGQMRVPTADEMKALVPPPTAAMRVGEPQAPQAVTRADGSRQLQLGERGLVYAVVTRSAEGKLAEQCVQGERAAEHALAHPVPNAHKKEHRHEDR